MANGRWYEEVDLICFASLETVTLCHSNHLRWIQKKACLEFVFLLKICWHLAQMLFPSSVFLCYEVCVSETFVSTLVLVHLRNRVLVGCWEFVVAILCPVEKFTFLVI